uniref:Caprin-1 dimerization domain-containing protein n=1 Tax=Acrobeloides nanus TaxID=290746 RepID=A0A914BZ14_9BILA
MKGPATGATLALNGGESFEIEAKTNGGAKTKENKDVTVMNNPFGKVEEALEKKLRNLEKRRQKQQQLKQELQNGKTLTDEQREAVLMINEVERQIEWIKEVQKMTQQQGRQYQRAIKQRDDVERKKKLETAIEATMVIAQLRELVEVFKKDEVKEAFAKGTDGAVGLNEEELRTLEKFNVLLQPLDGFNSFNEWHAQLGDSAKSLYYVVKGTEDELFPNVTGAMIKQLLGKIASSEFIQTLRFKDLIVKAETQENVERENVETPASPSLSTVSSNKTNTSQSQVSSELSRQSPSFEDVKKDSETPEAKVVFVANDASPSMNGSCEGQFVFAAEPVAESVVQNVTVMPSFIPGPAPVFIPVMTIPAPIPGVLSPEMVPNVASTYVPTSNENQPVNTNGNYQKNRPRDGNRNGNPRNAQKGPQQNRGPAGNRPYRHQSSRDSNSDSSNAEPRQNSKNGANFRPPRPNNQQGGYRGNRGGQPTRDNQQQPPKPKYQYGFRFAETPAN